jgi:hypothetical protein
MRARCVRACVRARGRGGGMMAHHNGRRGTVRAYDPGLRRYRVQMDAATLGTAGGGAPDEVVSAVSIFSQEQTLHR